MYQRNSVVTPAPFYITYYAERKRLPVPFRFIFGLFCEDVAGEGAAADVVGVAVGVGPSLLGLSLAFGGAVDDIVVVRERACLSGSNNVGVYHLEASQVRHHNGQFGYLIRYK